MFSILHPLAFWSLILHLYASAGANARAQTKRGAETIMIKHILKQENENKNKYK